MPAKKGARSKISDDAKFKVANTESVKRGFLAEYVERAKEMKMFTRAKLEDSYGGRASDAVMGTYFPYCVNKGIFAPAA